ncbi:MAG TPA: mechanosensitive ion channel family protein [Xanthomonadaceae bacterium]|jgi:small-conductance mechanosensitive channel
MFTSAPASSPAQQLLEHPVAQSTRLFDHLQRIDWPDLSIEWGARAGAALLLLAGGIWMSKWLSRLLVRLLTRFGVETILTNFLRAVIRAICLIVVFIAAMDVVGLPTTSLLAVIGAAGLGIGLALKDSLSNISAGVMLITLRPFHAGDEVQVAGLNGVVEQVRIFQTVLRTFDNRVIILPNSLITAAPITNFTARDRRRIDLTIGIGYEDDIRTARETLVTAARANRRVLAEPAPDVLVSALAESSINVVLRAWVATRDYAMAKSELLEAARAALGERGVSIPFPQQDLHVFHHGVEDAKQGEQKLAEAAAGKPKTASAPRGSDDASHEGDSTPSTPES